MFTAENAWLIWLVAAIALVAIEAASADFVFLMLAGGALAGAAAAGLGGNILVQAIVALVVAALLLTIVRPMLKRRFMQPAPSRMGVDAHIGELATVTEQVTTGSEGRVRLRGNIWSARLDSMLGDETPLEPGRSVVVARIEGATAIVRPDPLGPPDDLDLRETRQT